MTMKRRALHAIGWLAAAAVLGTVFAAYQRPGLAVDLASRLWSCF